MKRLAWVWGLIGVALAGLFAYVLLANANQPVRYITWDSLEPDIWASVWIVKNHLAPASEVVIRPLGAPANDGIAFGRDDAQYKRSSAGSVYEALLTDEHSGDPALQKIGKIIHDIEISPWATPTMQESAIVERAFRTMQDRFTDRVVPVACYGKFFDLTYQLLSENKSPDAWQPLQDFASNVSSCDNSQSIATRDNRPVVRRVEIHQILDYIGAGKKVIFVDAREQEEYDEFHIPGAIRMSLRDVNKNVLPQFEGADLVIGYCIKDFRGFELARSLASIGVKNAATMKPYGISGWMAAKLPTTGVNGLTEQQALDQLNNCATGSRQLRSHPA